MTCVTCGHQALHDMAGIGVCRAAGCGCDGPCDPQPPAPRASGRPSWLDRAVDEALTVCPTVAPWEMRLALIAAAPTIQAAAVTQTGRVRLVPADPDEHRMSAEEWADVTGGSGCPGCETCS